MKMGKNIILLSATIITLISLVAIATYSYFTASTSLTNKITTNVKMPLRPTFTVSGGGELILSIPKNLMLKENASSDGAQIIGKTITQASRNLTVTLTGEPGTTCTYNIYYKDTSLDSTIIQDWDFYIDFIKNGSNVFGSNFILIKQTSAGLAKITPIFGGSTAPFNKVKPVLTIPTGSTSATDTWQFIWTYVNRDRDQSYLADKTFKGEVYIGDVVCT